MEFTLLEPKPVIGDRLFAQILLLIHFVKIFFLVQQYNIANNRDRINIRPNHAHAAFVMNTKFTKKLFCV